MLLQKCHEHNRGYYLPKSVFKPFSGSVLCYPWISKSTLYIAETFYQSIMSQCTFSIDTALTEYVIFITFLNRIMRMLVKSVLPKLFGKVIPISCTHLRQHLGLPVPGCSSGHTTFLWLEMWKFGKKKTLKICRIHAVNLSLLA